MILFYFMQCVFELSCEVGFFFTSFSVVSNKLGGTGPGPKFMRDNKYERRRHSALIPPPTNHEGMMLYCENVPLKFFCALIYACRSSALCM
jgi:hypothetical protein